MIAGALALGIMGATVSGLIIWAALFYRHLTADDRRYRKNLRKERKTWTE